MFCANGVWDEGYMKTLRAYSFQVNYNNETAERHPHIHNMTSTEYRDLMKEYKRYTNLLYTLEIEL